MKKLLAACLLYPLLGAGMAAQAQTATPQPDPAALAEAYQQAIDRIPALAQLRDRGARILPLGRAYGLDGWLAQGQNGGVEVYYTTPDGLGLIQGLLFAPDGSSETERQLPGEGFLADVRNATWFAFGNANAPPLYVFVDPRCPFCKRLFDNLARNGIPDGAVQLRLIVVPALGPESLRQAALLLDADNPADAWRRLMAGDVSVVEGEPSEAAERIVRRNGDLTLRWQVDGVPFAVYRNVAGKVSIVDSEPADLPALLSDLGPEWPEPG